MANMPEGQEAGRPGINEAFDIWKLPSLHACQPSSLEHLLVTLG
jgi:hypothetical protein